GRFVVPYLALLPLGFSVPPRLLSERWSFTPTFHPYRCTYSLSGGFVFCGTVRRKALSNFPPACISARFLASAVRVTRQRALWSSDFPPPTRARGDSPPFQNQAHSKGSR